MRKLTALDEKLVPLFDEHKVENVEVMPTFRHCFKMALGQGQSKNADESRIAGKLLIKIRAKGDIEISDDDFKLLMERVSLNQAQFITSVHGQLLQRLDDCNK